MLAYIDSFAGLVPCRVTDVRDVRDPVLSTIYRQVTATVTADRGAYKRGEIVSLASHTIVPRTAVRRRKYSTRILPFHWEKTV
jgi:hypothetical protein